MPHVTGDNKQQSCDCCVVLQKGQGIWCRPLETQTTARYLLDGRQGCAWVEHHAGLASEVLDLQPTLAESAPSSNAVCRLAFHTGH